MDYEKAYKAVLQTATQWIKDGCTDKERICLECVFPELRESEDERVREEIIEFLQNTIIKRGIKDGNDKAVKWIAYLEKQKENPKSADSIPADCVSDVKCEDRSPKHSDSFGTDIRDTPAYWRGWDDAMEQKEQKPVEWNKKPCLTCQEYKKGFEAGRLEGVTAGYNKAVKEKEQKPAEWSEEDNIGWDEAFACVTRAEKAAKNEEELQNAVTAEKWLMEIKFKYYVHPVKQEWSEEDEKALKRAIDCVRSWEIDYCDGDNRISERLKSLRSSWKPSEEQMKALYCALCEEISRTHFDALESLYNDLKKLM